jgi:LCCL domain
MLHDDRSEARHEGRLPGMGTRERLTIAVPIALLVVAVALATNLGDLVPPVGPEPSRLAVAPSAVPAPTRGPATPTTGPITPAPSSDVFPCDSPAAPWSVNACDRRGSGGLTFQYDCPPGGTPGALWGDVVYTDGSSVCAAGVHAGVLTAVTGGTVDIVVRPARVGFVGTTRNGIASRSYDRWGGSFEVVGSATQLTSGCGPGFNFPAGDMWLMTPCAYRGQDGVELEYSCPAGDAPAPAWGHVVYTDDSSVCTAAVDAGAFSLDEGGIVRIAIRPGQDSYPASFGNGVSTDAFGHWDGSFEVLGP